MSNIKKGAITSYATEINKLQQKDLIAAIKLSNNKYNEFINAKEEQMNSKTIDTTDKIEISGGELRTAVEEGTYREIIPEPINKKIEVREEPKTENGEKEIEEVER